MAKGGKLTKLKSVLKKWNSFSSKLGRTINGTSIVAAATSHSSSDDESSYNYNYNNNNNNNNNNSISVSGRDLLHPVYVGKSRRRYLVTSDVVDNPVFRELVERSGGDNYDDNNSITVVGCEVVLFEHLLWMLENADPQPSDQSLDNFVEYYAC